MVELNSPLLGDLVLSLHLLFLEFSDIPHSDLLTELNKHLVLHLENKTFAWIFQEYNKHFTDSFLNKSISPGSSGPAGHWSPSHGTGWSSWCHWCVGQNWPTHSPTSIFPARQNKLKYNSTNQQHGGKCWCVARVYLHVEGQVASFCLFQITLGVLESHLKTVGLRLDLTQLCLLPLGLHLLLQSRWIKEKCCGLP